MESPEQEAAHLARVAANVKQHADQFPPLTNRQLASVLSRAGLQLSDLEAHMDIHPKRLYRLCVELVLRRTRDADA